MRNQRRAAVTVTIVRANLTKDNLGDGTGTPTECTVENCQFDPDDFGFAVSGRGAAERSGDDQVKVLRGGVLNIPGVHQLVADDTVRFYGSTWQVVGNGNVFLDRTKVRVQQPRRK